MKNILIAAILVFLSTTLGCASIQGRFSATLGDEFKHEQKDPDMATIYVFGNSEDEFEQPGLFIDDKRIAKLHKDGYIAVSVTAGKHIIELKRESIGFEVEENSHTFTKNYKSNNNYYFMVTSEAYTISQRNTYLGMSDYRNVRKVQLRIKEVKENAAMNWLGLRQKKKIQY